MSVLTGILKVQGTIELKKEIKKHGKAGCVLILDEIEDMDNVIDVWLPKDKEIDIIVETDATSRIQIDNLQKQILGLEGILKITSRISAEIDDEIK